MPPNFDFEAYFEMFQARYSLIVAAASAYAPTPDLVYDIVNEVFVDFMKAAGKGQVDPTRDPKPLLYKLAKHRAADHWRERKKETSEGFQLISEKLMDKHRENAEDLDRLNRRMDALNHCLELLPEKSRDVVRRHYFQQSSLEIIAETLAVPAGTLRKTLTRIRQALRDCILKQLKENR